MANKREFNFTPRRGISTFDRFRTDFEPGMHLHRTQVDLADDTAVDGCAAGLR